ncbi:hypothetical protein ACYF6T_23365 [Streptomyces sp. 7R007]
MTAISDVHADAMAYVCAHRDRLRDELRQLGDGHEQVLERLLEQAAGDADGWAELLDRLDEALLAEGDALGLYGRGARGPSVRDLRPAGIAAAPAGEVVYVCPGARCSRHWWPESGGDTPACAVEGRPLRRARL